jgi:cysteine-rich repeat protein
MSSEKRAEVEQVCPNSEQDCCEMLDLRTNNNIQLICPRDSNQWETDTGMFTCRKGQYSSEDADLAPCLDCPHGTVSSSIGSTKCTACDQGFYANPLCSDKGQCPQEFSQEGVGLKPREKCIRCPEGTSTLTDKSELADCKPCPDLVELTSNDIPFCVDPRQQRTTTAVLVQTTPAPPKNCGNGIQIFPEQCDDNNTASSDGCSDECTIEQGWFCFQQVRVRKNYSLLAKTAG